MRTCDSSCPCQGCGQTITAQFVEELTPSSSLWTIPSRCDACRARDREPQGETVRLFEPAPAVMPGQLDWSAIVDTTC